MSVLLSSRGRVEINPGEGLSIVEQESGKSFREMVTGLELCLVTKPGRF